MKDFAVALRSELYMRDELLRLVSVLDGVRGVSHIFFPDIPNGLEAFELSIAALASTTRVSVGSGVVRIAEYNPKIIGRRLGTIQFLFRNRFVLGIGTGSPGNNPREAIERMFEALEGAKNSFVRNSSNLGAVFPDVLVAALKSRMAETAMKRADGLLLNFCSPEYAKRLISDARHLDPTGGKKMMACYVKLFYSERQNIAEKSLIREFTKYDSLPQYHRMFEKDGVASTIHDLKVRLSEGQRLEVPDNLKRICLANPTEDELLSHLKKYEESGVDLPCVYPYFGDEERTDFKLSKIRSIANTLSS